MFRDKGLSSGLSFKEEKRSSVFPGMKIPKEYTGIGKRRCTVICMENDMQIMIMTIALTQKNGTVHLLLLTPIQLKALFGRCILAIIQVDLNSLKYLSPDFSQLSDSKENQSSTSALGNFLLIDLQPKEMCFLNYYYKVNIIIIR